jgi:hypothetical protein
VEEGKSIDEWDPGQGSISLYLHSSRRQVELGDVRKVWFRFGLKKHVRMCFLLRRASRAFRIEGERAVRTVRLGSRIPVGPEEACASNESLQGEGFAKEDRC